MITFDKLNVLRISMKDKMRIFTTKDINYKWMTLNIINSTFIENTLELGYFFEFKHNFDTTIFKNCLIQGNTGYFLEMTPSDQSNLSLM